MERLAPLGPEDDFRRGVMSLRIVDIVLGAGTRFALPSRTRYLESGAGLDEEIERLRGTVPHPPEGSPSPDDASRS